MISRYLSYRTGELCYLQLLSKISLQTCKQYLPLSRLHTCHRTNTGLYVVCAMNEETQQVLTELNTATCIVGGAVWISAAQCQLLGFYSISSFLNPIFHYIICLVRISWEYHQILFKNYHWTIIEFLNKLYYPHVDQAHMDSVMEAEIVACRVCLW